MDRYDVVVTGYPDSAAQPAVPTLQRILGLSEADATRIARSFPCVVLAHQDGPTVQRIGIALKQAGALVELRISSGPAPAPQPTKSEPAAGYVIGDLALGEPEPPPRAPAPAPAPVAAPAAPAKPGENVATGNVQMLDDGFGGEEERGPALELDYEAGVKKTGTPSAAKAPKAEGKKVPSSAEAPKSSGTQGKASPEAAPAPASGHKYAVHGAKAEAPQRGRINVRDKGRPSSGALTVVLTVLLVVASLAGAYKFYGPLLEPEARPPRQSVLARRRARAVLAASKAQLAAKPVDEQVAPDAPPSGSPSAPNGKEGEPAKDASTNIMAWAEATERREHMHGVHKIVVEWPATDKPSQPAECVLLDRKYESKLDDLEKTGKRFEPSPAVAKQIKDRVSELQTSKRYKDREFLALCLSN